MLYISCSRYLSKLLPFFLGGNYDLPKSTQHNAFQENSLPFWLSGFLVSNRMANHSLATKGNQSFNLLLLWLVQLFFVFVLDPRTLQQRALHYIFGWIAAVLDCTSFSTLGNRRDIF